MGDHLWFLELPVLRVVSEGKHLHFLEDAQHGLDWCQTVHGLAQAGQRALDSPSVGLP